MTLKKQLLLLLLIHLFAAMAAWDGYRIGYHRGRGETLKPQTRIEVENPQPVPEPHRKTWDANWRLTSSSPRKKWYITGGHREHPETQNDCTIEPIVTYGKDSLEAIENSGITVWPEEKYMEIRDAFLQTCRVRKP